MTNVVEGAGVVVVGASIGASSAACCSADGALYTFGRGTGLGHGNANDTKLTPTRVQRWGCEPQHLSAISLLSSDLSSLVFC